MSEIRHKNPSFLLSFPNEKIPGKAKYTKTGCKEQRILEDKMNKNDLKK
jgi:hypothetical protein